MQSDDPIRVSPAHAILEQIEDKTQRILEEKFPVLLDPLVEFCRIIEEFVIEHLRHCVLAEMADRFENDFEVKNERVFVLNRTRYVYTFQPDLAANGVKCTFFREDDPLGKHQTRELTKRFPQSLTYLSVVVKTAPELREIRPVVGDLAMQVVRSVDRWLEHKLNDANRRAGTHAVLAIQDLLKQEFGALANRMYFYSLTKTAAGVEGSYRLSTSVFEEVMDRIKRSGENYVSAAIQSAAFIDSLVNRDQTESRYVLGQHMGWQRVPSIKSGRLYEVCAQAFHAAEQRAYDPEEPIVQPLVYAGDVEGLELVVCYSSRLVLQDSTVPDRVERLRPRMLDILKNHDVIHPIVARRNRLKAIENLPTLQHPSRLPSTDENIVALRMEVMKDLAMTFAYAAIGSEASDVAQHVQFIERRIRECARTEILEEVRRLAASPRGASTILAIRSLLESQWSKT